VLVGSAGQIYLDGLIEMPREPLMSFVCRLQLLECRVESYVLARVCVCVSMRRQYVPLSLHTLQRLVDLGRIDVEQPIDLTALCNTRVVTVNPEKKHYGINLTDDVCLLSTLTSANVKMRNILHRVAWPTRWR